MDQYFKISIKNHKILKKKILCLEYLPEKFFPDDLLIKEMITFYMTNLTQNKDEDDKLIIIFDLRNINNYDTQKVWYGAGELKRYEDFFVKNIQEAYILIENQLIIDFVNIILKVVGTNIETTLVKNITQVLEKLK